MRNVLVLVFAVGLLAAPSLGGIDVKLVADQTQLVPGQTTTIHILGDGTMGGVFSLGGNIVASGTPGLLIANPGSFAWVPEFNPVPVGGVIPRVGTPGTNGGWNSFGSMQTDFMSGADPYFGAWSYVELASYTVTAQAVAGSVTLTFSGASVGGFLPLDTFHSAGVTWTIPVKITTVPEPTTLVLVAIGGLLFARRRQH